MLRCRNRRKPVWRIVIGMRTNALRTGGRRASRISQVKPVIDDDLRLQFPDHGIRRLLIPHGGTTVGIEPEQIYLAVIASSNSRQFSASAARSVVVSCGSPGRANPSASNTSQSLFLASSRFGQSAQTSAFERRVVSCNRTPSSPKRNPSQCLVVDHVFHAGRSRWSSLFRIEFRRVNSL